MTRCQRCFGDLSEFAVFCPNCAQVHEPDLSQLLNQVVGGRYKIYRRLGQGGLSTVFAATDLQSDNIVVVKVSDPAQLVRRELTYAIDAEAARNYWQEMLERMRHEAETLTGIDHTNIVRLFDSGMIGDDLRFVAMEFLRGRTLREELDARGKLDIAEAASIALQLCDALGEVHARGIVHRDINPRNVMLGGEGEKERQREAETGRVENRTIHSIPQSPRPAVSQSLRPSVVKAKLIDFGIAKFPQPPGAPPFTQHSVLSGTVAYASPEQCQSRAVDQRSDIYSLGVMLYEMLTGQRPFKGRTPTEIAIHHLQSEPQPPRQLNSEIPSSLEKTILRALAKAAEDRQQDVSELAEQIRSATRQIVVPLASDPTPENYEAPETIERLALVRRRRRRLAVTVAAVLLVMLAAGIFGRNWLASRALPLLTEKLAGKLTGTPTPLPENPIASDSDSLELAAQLPADSLAGGRSTTNAAGSTATAQSPQSSPQSTAAVSAGANAGTASNGSAKSPNQPATVPANQTSTTSKSQQTLPAPMHVPTPAPTPVIAAKQAPPTNSQPNAKDAAKAPGQSEERPENRKVRQRDGDLASASNSSHEQPRIEPSATRDRVVSPRNRDDVTVRRDSADDDGGGNQGSGHQQEPDPIGPKLIQWSGRVSGEREVLVDLPGAPGTLEIPRVYRNRVAVIEPPSASNRWRCVRLRVFGEGGVSFVVRWWPMAQMTKLAGR